MKKIEHYIVEVMHYLPAAARENVAEELRAEIAGMLPENPTEDDVQQVLTELGKPWQVAASYNTENNYLVGPAFYQSYLSILLLVVGIGAAVSLVFTVLDWIISGPSFDNLFGFILQLIASIFNGVIQGAFWVTVVFVVLERNGVNPSELPVFRKDGSLSAALKQPVSDPRRISRAETLFEMIFLLIFTALFYYRHQLIALYTNLDGNLERTSLLVNEQLQYYMPFILALAAVNFVVLIFKFIWRRWNVSLAISNLFYNLLAGLLAVVMLLDDKLFNPEFFAKLNQMLGNTASSAQQWPATTIRVLIAVIILTSMWDALEPFLKLRKRAKYQGE